MLTTNSKPSKVGTEELLRHLFIQSDLASSDFRLFFTMEEALRGMRFENNEDVKALVQLWLRGQRTALFADVIKNPVNRWEMSINNARDYFGK